jgi:hypothetical protein
MTTARMALNDEDARALFITGDKGYEWEEPIAGWCLVLDLIHGGRYWQHTDGRRLADIT